MPWFSAPSSRSPRSSSLARREQTRRRRLLLEPLDARVVLASDLYIDDSFAGFTDGQLITDADLGTAGDQPATFNVNAFATLNAALAVAAIDDTLIINTGIYNEVADVTGNRIVRLSGSVSINSLDTAATVPLNLQAHTLTIGDATGAHTIAGVISGSGGLVKLGADTLTLSGVNTFTGSTLISQGLVIAGTSSISAGSFGAFNSSPTKIVVQSGATLDVNGRAAAGRDFFYGVTISGTGTSGQGALVNNGTSGGTGQRQTPFITLAADATIGGTGNIYMINAGYAANTLNLGGFALTKTGSNVFGLVNTTVTAGTINIASGVVSPSNVASNFSAAHIVLANTAGAALALNGFNVTVASLAGGGTAGGNVNLGGNTLTINQSTTTTYAGIISGTGGITKSGTGTLTIAGLNTYSGNTLITQGTVIAGASNTVTGAFGAFNASPSKIVVQSGATLDVNGRAAPGLDFYYGVTISGTGTSGQGALINNGPNHGGGNVQLPFITLAGNATVGGSGNFYLLNYGYGATTLDLAGFTLTKAGTNTMFLVNTTVTAGNLQIDGGTLSQATNAANLSAVNVSLANNAGAALALNGLNLTVGSLAGGGATGGNVAVGASTLTINQSSNTTFSGSFTGTGNIVKSGAGTLTLSGASTFTGRTIISQGTLQLGTATGAGTGPITLNDANTGASNTSLLASFASGGAVIGNAITVANLGSGVSSIGTTSFNVGGVPTRWTGAISLIKAATFIGGNADRTSYEGIISGAAGTITVTGGARTTWDNTNTFVANVQLVGAGTILQLNSSTNVIPDATTIDIGAGALLYSNNASETIAGLTGTGTVQRHPSVTGTFTLTIGAGNTSSTFGGVIANGGGTVALVKTGSGTLLLQGANTYTGSTLVSAGTLGGNGSLTSAVTVAGNAAVSPGGTQCFTASRIAIPDRANAHRRRRHFRADSGRCFALWQRQGERY